MIIILGLPGVGKSSILKGIKEKKPDYEIINYGDLMLEVFKKYGINDRDEIRKAPIELQKKVQKQVASILSKKKGKVILDTHCSIKTPKGYLPGLPFDLLKKLKVDNLILISAEPEEIKRRRESDSTRKRETTLEEIIEHDTINKSYLASYSAFTGAPALIVMNRDNKLNEAIDTILNILE